MHALVMKPTFRIRQLAVADLAAVRRHFGNLDATSRRARFGGAISDQALARYADRLLKDGSLVVGAVVGAELRGLGELRRFDPSDTAKAELALSVEPDWQGTGMGGALFDRLIAVARTQDIRSIHIVCATSNLHMRHLAVERGARLSFGADVVEAILHVPAHAMPHRLLRWDQRATREPDLPRAA